MPDALSAIQRDHDVTGQDAPAASLATLDDPYAFRGRLMQKALEPIPRRYRAIILNLVQVLDKLERGERYHIWRRTGPAGP